MKKEGGTMTTTEKRKAIAKHAHSGANRIIKALVDYDIQGPPADRILTEVHNILEHLREIEAV